MNILITDENYFIELKATFPLLVSKIDQWLESSHFRMEAFADYTIEQIIRNNFSELERCFDFQESRIGHISADLENALKVSYCEALMLGASGSRMDEIVKIMPDKLRSHYIQYKKWYDNLVEASRK